MDAARLEKQLPPGGEKNDSSGLPFTQSPPPARLSSRYNPQAQQFRQSHATEYTDRSPLNYYFPPVPPIDDSKVPPQYSVHETPVTATATLDSDSDYNCVKVGKQNKPLQLQPARKSGGRHSRRFKVVKWLAVFCFIAFLLTLPLIFLHQYASLEAYASGSDQFNNLLYYAFAYILSCWFIAAAAFIWANMLPYIFRFTMHYLNPAYKRYWRVLTMMKRPIIFLGTIIGAWLAYAILLESNPDLFINSAGWAAIQQMNATTEATTAESDSTASLPATTSLSSTTLNSTGTSTVDSSYGSSAADASSAGVGGDSTMQLLQILGVCLGVVIQDLLLTLVLWACMYTIEKMLITYMAIHYQFRSNFGTIKRNKRMIEALSILYDVSYSMYPVGSITFATEDAIIHQARDTASTEKSLGRAAVVKLDHVSGRFVSAFGIVFGSSAESHWFASRSTYATVSRALQHPGASAALAKRIWVSLVAEGQDALYLEDLQEALGPHRTEEAENLFAVLDENENGSVRLHEMVPAVVEAGISRHNIYNNMTSLDHCVNTFDWLLVGAIALIVLLMVLLMYVPKIKQMSNVIGLGALGVSAAMGKVVGEFIQGAMFTILHHPYDIGDTVEVLNGGESLAMVAIVRRISLLYTVFEEVDTGKHVQFSNFRTMLKRIHNLSRSGQNREDVKIVVDFGTTFKDLQLLRSELVNFITAPENSRDYCPDLSVRMTNLYDLGRMELVISVTHKSNWSNQELKAARSSRFHCAIVAVCRKIPINKPLGGKAVLGDEGKPYYMVHINDTEAAAKRDKETKRQQKVRMDFVEPKSDAATDVQVAEQLSAAEVAAKEAEEQKAMEEKAEKEAKEAKAKAEEAEARSQLTDIPREGLEPHMFGNHAATWTGFESGNASQSLVSGFERGLRRTSGSRSRAPSPYH